jgi:hypothetical protein
VEERVNELQLRKRQLKAVILNADGGPMHTLTLDDLKLPLK